VGAAGDSDHAQAARAEADVLIAEEAVLVGATVTNGVVHPRQQLLVNRLPVVSNDPYDSTHW
jgi:hypothetical protein